MLFGSLQGIVTCGVAFQKKIKSIFLKQRHKALFKRIAVFTIRRGLEGRQTAE